MIINYNSTSEDRQAPGATTELVQTSESNMPLGVNLSSPPGESNMLTEQSNNAPPQAYGNIAPSSTKNTNSDVAAQILAIANDSSFALSSSNRGGAKTMNTTINNNGQSGVNNQDEEIMFIGRKVEKNQY